jgi:uncharacterized membrane protein YtjA (UPF0391 family)
VLIGYDNEMTVEGPASGGGVDREPVAGGLASVGACAWPRGHETAGCRLFSRQGNTRIPLIDRVSSLTSCCSTEVPNEPFASAVEWLWNLRRAREGRPLAAASGTVGRSRPRECHVTTTGSASTKSTFASQHVGAERARPMVDTRAASQLGRTAENGLPEAASAAVGRTWWRLRQSVDHRLGVLRHQRHRRLRIAATPSAEARPEGQSTRRARGISLLTGWALPGSDDRELSAVERIAGKEHCPITFRTRWRTRQHGGFAMLNWVVTLLIIALIAAVLGFGGIAGTAIGLAKLIFYVAIILFLISLIFGYSRGGFRFPR